MFALSAFSASAQVTRKILMEEYTGTWCPNCPDGHDTIKKILTTYPNRVVAVGMHNNDAYTIPYEQAMESAMQVSGFPRATIDRDSFPGANYFAMSRWFWTNAVADRLNVTSPVEIKITPTYNKATRQLTAKVDYTFKSAVNYETRLTCVLLEDSIIAAQSGSSNPNYEHKDVCRHLLSSDNWGDANHPSSVSVNQSFSKTYTYTLPAAWNDRQITVVAFINKKVGTSPILSQGTEILNAEEAKVGVATSIKDIDKTQFQVSECYPNPATDLTAIDFSLPKDAQVKAYVTNISGAVIKELSHGYRSAGKHSVYWAGTNQAAQRMPNGIYFVTLSIDGVLFSKKVMIKD